MKVFFLWHYYPRYLKAFAGEHPELQGCAFAERRQALFRDHYAWPAELAEHMASRGIETEFIVGNAEWLQKRWAEESGFRDYSPGCWETEIALEQIRRFRPDVVWVSQCAEYSGPFAREALRYAGRVMMWAGEPWPALPDMGGISVLVTEHPSTFREVQHRFERVIVTKPGFCPDILGLLGPVEKKHDIVFIGQFTRVHQRRAEVVAHLLRHGLRVGVWGAVEEGVLPGFRQGARLALWHGIKQRDLRQACMALRRMARPTLYERDADTVARACRTPVFGMEMYRKLASARVALNVHADIAGWHAGNLRMFQATGVGACLATEASDNIRDLFEPGGEVLTYRSKEDLLALLNEVLQQSDKIERVGRAGQERVLRDHSLDRMWRDVSPAFEG